MNGVTTRPRTKARLLALAGACGLAILSLSGCIKVNSDLTIASDATASGTLSMELQKQAASLMMISDLDSFKKATTSGDLSGQGLGEFGTCAASETSDAFVYTCTFTDMAFTKADGPWTITKDGNQILFTMVNKAADTTGATGGADASALLGGASLGEINANVTFPGPITGVQGAQATKTSDTTATIKASLTDNVEVRITSDASGGGKIAALLVVAVALLVLLLIVVVVVVMILRRRKAHSIADVPAEGAVAVEGDVPAESAVAAAADMPAESAVPAVPAEGAVVAETVADPAETVADPAETVAEPVVLADAGAPVEEAAAVEQTAPAEEPTPAAAEPAPVEEPPKPE